MTTGSSLTQNHSRSQSEIRGDLPRWHFDSSQIRGRYFNADCATHAIKSPRAIYQQDNARPHTARLSQQCLQGYDVLPWPARSPDLSPIEHVCDALGMQPSRYRRINCADAKTMAGSSTGGRKSNKGNAGLEVPRLKRKVGSNGSVDRTDKKRSKICRKRSLQGSEDGDQKRPTPKPTQGIKRTIPSSVASRKYKYRRPNNPSQGSQSIGGSSHQIDTSQGKPPTEGSRQGASVQYDRARETRTTPSGRNSAAQRRPVRSGQATAVRSCPYYLRSRAKQSEGIPEEQWNRQYPAEQPQEKEPQHGSLKRRSGG
ncbi:uncharacterized protein TNCV_2769211 [Trichonephila clavipes]|nr:uncharacterized protein TNCV_2769211 [Trichonephila clavipes]